MHRRRKIAAQMPVLGICLCLAAIVWFVFGQTLGHDFINYDDDRYVYENPSVRKGLTVHGIGWAFGHSVSHNWHPLTMITHMLDCQLYGLKAGGHHCTNVVLHTLAVVLLFVVLREMTGATWRSAFVAALFAIHPLRVESVAWVAERKDVLSGVFFLLTLAAYLRYVRNPSLASYVLVIFLFACGLMSKPMLVTLPFVLLLLDYWPLGRFTAQGSLKVDVKSLHWWDQQSIPRKLILEKIPLLVLSATSCVITLFVQGQAVKSIVHFPLPLRVYNALVSYVAYIRQVFWPGRLAVFYPYPSGRLSIWLPMFAIAVLLAISYTAWVVRKQHPYIVSGWLWYLGMLVPVIGLLQVGEQARADRYTYLPQIGLYLLLAWTVTDLSASWGHRRKILSLLVITGIVVLTWRAWIQTSYWKNGESIWNRTLAVTSRNAIAHEHLGHLLLERGQLDDGIFHLQEALKIRPDFSEVHYNLSMAFLEKGLVDAAIFHGRKAVELLPERAEVHYWLGAALWRKGDVDQAIAHWQKTLSIRPNYANAETSLGTAFLRKRLIGEAIIHYERSLAIAPQSAVTLNNLAQLLSVCPDAQFRNGPRAIELAEQADQLAGGKNPSYVRTLAAAYAESARFDKAIEVAQRALQLAVAQGDSGLASKLRMDIDLYRMSFPIRDLDLTNGRAVR